MLLQFGANPVNCTFHAVLHSTNYNAWSSLSWISQELQLGIDTIALETHRSVEQETGKREKQRQYGDMFD